MLAEHNVVLLLVVGANVQGFANVSPIVYPLSLSLYVFLSLLLSFFYPLYLSVSLSLSLSSSLFFFTFLSITFTRARVPLLEGKNGDGDTSDVRRRRC